VWLTFVIVLILGEAFLELLDLLSGEVVSSLGVLPMVVGFVAAFVSGCLACKFMINIVRRQKLIYFAIYCLLAGIFAIVYGLC
jgi:undecaprenyl-diphosphatase